jgi:hypothetical protein
MVPHVLAGHLLAVTPGAGFARIIRRVVGALLVAKELAATGAEGTRGSRKHRGIASAGGCLGRCDLRAEHCDTKSTGQVSRASDRRNIEQNYGPTTIRKPV